MPKVSIIVPVYNVEKYIERCLNSLIMQTLQDIEIVIINDGSTDLSKEIIQNFLIKEPLKIKYFEKENGGLSSARNMGLLNAKGEYIAFLDADDYVEPNMYEIMYKEAKINNADMVECDFIWEYVDYKKYDIRRKYKTKRDIMKKPRVVAWNKLIKREIIKKYSITFPKGLIYEDVEFFFKLLPYLYKIVYVPQFFVHYVQRENSIIKNNGKKLGDIFIILDNIITYYKEIGQYDKYKKELNYMCIRICFGSSMKRIVKIKDKKLRWKLICTTFLKCNSLCSKRLKIKKM